MTVSLPPGRNSLQYTSGNLEQQLRTTAEVVNSMLAGKLNVTLFLTLTPSTTTTTVIDSRISRQTTACFCPTSADGATALLAGIWVTPTNGQMVVHHASNAAIDQNFNCSLIG